MHATRICRHLPSEHAWLLAGWVLTDMDRHATPAAAFRAYFSRQVATSSEGPAAQQLKTAILGSGKKVRLPSIVW